MGVANITGNIEKPKRAIAMTLTTQTIDNATISAFGAQVPKSVVFAIHDASRKSGVDFSYLVKQAGVESSFNPDAKAKGSTATGLYQFIQRTWLDMVEKHGDKYGIDANLPRKDLLALRRDPELSSYMAAELANENRDTLERNWGGDIGETELYLAHFMGAGGASSFLKAKDRNPMVAAADLFPEAARSNRAVFFDGRTGRARSVAEVYEFFDRKFEQYEPGVAKLAAAVDEKHQPVQTAAASAAGPAKAARAEPPPVILPATSVVFSMRPQYGGYQPPASEMTLDTQTALSGYQKMVVNPVELMMLSQLEMPSGDKNSRFF